MTPMKVALLFPPQGHFTQPYLSLPSLTAYLRTHGHEVEQFDENIEAYDHFLSEAYLRRALEKIDARARMAELDAKSELVFSDMERYQVLSEIAVAGDEVAGSIEEAKRVIRSKEDFYDYERYLWAGRTIEQGLRIVSTAFAPTKLTAHGFIMRFRVERTDEIIAALDCEDENPFVDFFREHTMPRLKAADPDLIGISLTFASQVIPVLTLCRQIKAWKPDVHITVGGGLLAYTAEKLSKREELWGLIDSLVLLEGERPLLQLTEHVAGERDLADVTNIIYRDDAGEVRVTPQEKPLDISTLPTPDFDGLPLDRYFSPELVLPLAATRGCYWGKCVFCTLYTVIGPGYRGRSIEQTIEDMRSLQEKHGANSFYLAIEDLPPEMARAFPRAILDAGLNVNWWCDARLEHKVFDEEVCRDLAASGCKRIAYGYESASKRVLARMCKGIDPEESMKLIRRTHDAGISVTLYAMIGFPTETREEAMETLETILANRDSIQEVSARVFYLDERSEIFQRREEFDIDEIYPDPEADLQVYYDFHCKSGMSRAEARQVYLDFTKALRSHFPVFQNTNMLYHELKSHYFLYLVKHGTFEALRDEVLEPNVERVAATGGRPRRGDHVLELPLAFDRSVLDDIVNSIDSATIRPRYQSDLLEDEDRARFDRELPPLARSPSTLLYNARTAEVQCLSPAAADLLERCDGRRSPEEIVSVYPEEVRPQALAALETISKAGLIEAVPPRH
ncbi:MAG TPA: radical SAM protein [Planctomycetes bacterium]|nr:radical SAM protein [Planctomycetota bacterium]